MQRYQNNPKHIKKLVIISEINLFRAVLFPQFTFKKIALAFLLFMTVETY